VRHANERSECRMQRAADAAVAVRPAYLLCVSCEAGHSIKILKHSFALSCMLIKSNALNALKNAQDQ